MPETKTSITRRNLLAGAAMPAAAALFAPQTVLGSGYGDRRPTPEPSILHLPVLFQPDLMFAYVGDVEAERYRLTRTSSMWAGSARAATLQVEFAAAERQATVRLASPTLPVQRIHLRWQRRLPDRVLALGDAWERSYGDLEWRPLQAERPLPWYAMLHENEWTAGIGVKTGAAAFAFWQVDPAGISLWLDTRNGGTGVQLGQRRLEVATIVSCQGGPPERAFAVTRRLCQSMAAGTPVPATRGSTSLNAVFGSNDWYYAYGHNTHDGILRDADLVRSLAPAGGNKPFTVIDDGYQDRSRFPSLKKLADEIRNREVTPGIWIRPLRAPATAPDNMLLPAARWVGSGSEQPPLAYDPTIPESLAAIAAVAEEACGWGFDLIKHDFTTYELFGRWGSQMGASPAEGNWHCNDRTLTNAEIVTALYRRLRAGCGEERVILGCNTIGHLSVGFFDASRTGDDVSGRVWERTRRIGVNTLAFRLPQHETFYAVDADCVPITPAVPWSMSRQWLHAVACSGTVLLVSPDPAAIGSEQKDALRAAFARRVLQQSCEPVDWIDTRTPRLWRSPQRTETFSWVLEEGESPFPIGVQRGPD